MYFNSDDNLINNVNNFHPGNVQSYNGLFYV